MHRWLQAGLLAAFAGSLAVADEVPLKSGGEEQQCSGMYNKKAWGGKVDPAITIKFTPHEEDHSISLIIFEWNDEEYLGRYPSEDSFEKQYICTDNAVRAELCNSTDVGKFILEPETNRSSTGSIFNIKLDLKEVKPILYPIKRTGYYCVWSNAFPPGDLKYDAVVTFQSSYGELSASQIAKLPFYGGLTIVYALISALWAFLYVQHRRDILPVQNYITAILIFLMLEMLITWAFYDYKNAHGSNTGAKILMIVVAILNAIRNSFSFFLLLIVCMGYGVVRPSLGAMMKWVRILALAHFLFGMVYAIGSLAITPDNVGPLIMLVILPLAATLTAFYIWTLNSLKFTMKDLFDRKQNVKLLMYKRLWWVLIGSIMVIFGFFFLNSFTFTRHGSPDFVPTHWKTRWFVLDGWLNLVYLVDLSVIAYLWRPTANNRRFAMSDELAQDDDGFEIASMVDSEDGRDEEMGIGTRNAEASRPLQPVQSSPATKRSLDRRDSVEGETMFSVGEDDRWSGDEDDSDDDEESKRGLTGKKKE
ncbi:unnamed protein product [Tuber aestivum]|uniref:Intimal thickness related receptor IRP domain-containing protein n=1 Tax=Tuber aestivum TaxID=59557 RepID=A0A292PJL6_9PEZI|nr:unnamed protein product [Tuber aestivum]